MTHDLNRIFFSLIIYILHNVCVRCNGIHTDEFFGFIICNQLIQKVIGIWKKITIHIFPKQSQIKLMSEIEENLNEWHCIQLDLF